MTIVGATFHEEERARRARTRLLEEIRLRNEPQIVPCASPDVPGEAFVLLGARVPDEELERARALIEQEGGEVETAIPEAYLQV